MRSAKIFFVFIEYDKASAGSLIYGQKKYPL